MARAIWKGIVKFGSVQLPVKLYSAVQDQGIHFRLLHAKDKQPVKQHMVHPETGDIVESADVKKGIEVDRGVYVVIDEEELEELAPPESRDIEITRFIPLTQLTHEWYNRPYYLGPDESDNDEYFAMVHALNNLEKQGVARWTMRKKEYIGVLRAVDEHLMLITLRNAEEVVPMSSLPKPEGRALDQKELKLAQQLVSALEGSFDPAEYADEYRERLMAMIETKAKGGKVTVRKFKPKKPAQKSLAEILEASLEGAGSAKKKKKTA